MDKQDVLEWWSEQAFDLEIEEHQGNCRWCWKKSLNKHMHIIDETPEVYDFPRRMEHLYPLVGPDNPTTPRKFFRGQMTVDALFDAHKALNGKLPRITADSGSCGESCELFPMETKTFLMRHNVQIEGQAASGLSRSNDGLGTDNGE